MGVTIADSSAVGYYFTPQVTSADREVVRKACEVFTARPPPQAIHLRLRSGGQRRDGAGDRDAGRRKRTCSTCTPQQRKRGAVFNRFGLANVRSGGHSVEFYLDDVTYTARRAPGTRPKFIPQTRVEVPYPHKQAGRRY